MAQVPTLSLPDVPQQVTPVGPQNVDSAAANPLLAGAQATGDLAQHALQIQGTMNQLAANDSSNAVVPKLDQIVTDYKTNNKGVYAAAAAPQVLGQLQSTLDSGKQGLSLDAQLAYDQVAHRVYSYAVSAVQQHVTTQTNEAVQNSSKASIELNAGLGTQALLSGDENGLHASIAEIAKQVAFMQSGAGTGAGTDTAAGHLMLQQSLGAIYVNAVKQLVDQNDYTRARGVLDDNYNKEVQNMTPDQYTALDNLLKVKGQSTLIHSLVAHFITGGPTATSANLSNAIAGVEHGTDKNGDGVVSRDPDTGAPIAYGKFQITPATAARYNIPVNGKSFDPNNPDHLDTLQNDEAYNTQVHQAILDHLTQKYAGNPLLIAGAYNAGEGWMDRQLANPKIGSPQPGNEAQWIASLPDKGVAKYVADVASRLQPQSTPTVFSTNTDPDAVEASALSRGVAFARQTLPEGQQDQFITELQSQLNVQSRITKMQINSAIGTLNSLIVGVNGQPGAADMNDLMSKPGAAALIASLPDKYKAEIPFMLGKAVSIPPSAAQEANATYLIGHMNTNPTQIADLDFSKYDLAPRDLRKIVIEAGQIHGNEQKIEDNVKSLLASPAAQAYVKLNFPKPEDRIHNPEYDQFVGALLGKTRAFMQDPANNGKYPQSGDIDTMVGQLTQERTVGQANVFGVPIPNTGHVVDNGYVVPDQAAAYIRSQLVAAGHPADDTEVARQFFTNPGYFSTQGLFYRPSAPAKVKK